jgi:hypothetical protein
MRGRPPRLTEPAADAERWRLSRAGKALPRRLRRDADRLSAFDHGGTSDAPTVTGSRQDGSALGSLLRTLHQRYGWVVDATVMEALDPATALALGRVDAIQVRGPRPAVAVGAGAGTGATAQVTSGADPAGRLELVTGTGQAAGTLLTVTFVAARADANYGVWLFPEDASAMNATPFVRVSSKTTTGWVLTNTGTAIGSSLDFYWNYLVVEWEEA